MDATIEKMFELAISLREERRFNEAIDVLKTIISTNPEDPKLSVVFTVLAGTYDSVKDYKSSEVCFRRATELNPKSELASLGLYVSLVNLNADENAIGELKRYLDVYPAKLYIDTLEELMGDLNDGYATKFRDIILPLAIKNDIS